MNIKDIQQQFPAELRGPDCKAYVTQETKERLEGRSEDSIQKQFASIITNNDGVVMVGDMTISADARQRTISIHFGDEEKQIQVDKNFVSAVDGAIAATITSEYLGRNQDETLQAVKKEVERVNEFKLVAGANGEVQKIEPTNVPEHLRENQEIVEAAMSR